MTAEMRGGTRVETEEYLGDSTLLPEASNSQAMSTWSACHQKELKKVIIRVLCLPSASLRVS